jgi:hypothetical protein
MTGDPQPGDGARIPDDWTAEPFHSDTVAYAIAKAMDPDRLKWEAERFQAYWSAKGGKKARKMNWQAAWVQWILNTRRYDGFDGAAQRRRR